MPIKKATDLQVAEKFLQIRQSAVDRGFQFNLSLRTIRRLMNTERCFFTQMYFTAKGGEPNSRTFDRVDNSKGYVEGNVVACSKRFNEIKANITVSDAVLLMKGFKKKKLI